MKLRIGISYTLPDNPKYLKYGEAIVKAGEATGNEVELVYLRDEPGAVASCDAVVFTGGADIAPERFGKAEERHLCHEIDEARDNVEFDIAKRVESMNLPILGICRGLQLLNVVYGGTLVTDIESRGGVDHKKLDATTDSRHEIKLTAGSHLYKIFRQIHGEVNSAHHQAIERLGAGLTASATDERDGTIEAIEWEDPGGKPYMLAVQWHPERMKYEERFAGPLFESFLWEVAAHKLLHDRLKISDRERERRAERERDSNG
jgi:putative glutamine amidotransferase